MNIPESLPTLSAGAHSPGSGRACLMEYVSLLAGESWSASPDCTHPVLAGSARATNDRISDANRHLLVPLIGRLFGTSESGTPLDRRILSVRLATFAARSVLHLVTDEGQAEAAIKAAESWTDDPCKATKEVAYTAHTACAAFATYADTYAADYAAAAVNAAGNAARAAYTDAYGRDQVLADGLTALIDEYDRLTGRTTWHELSHVELADLAAAI